MGLGHWLRQVMEADDGYEPAPDAVVTVGYVHAALSEIVIGELAAAGIHADAIVQRAGYGAPVNARIQCFARDAEAATVVIDRVFAETADDADDGEPLRP